MSSWLYVNTSKYLSSPCTVVFVLDCSRHSLTESSTVPSTGQFCIQLHLVACVTMGNAAVVVDVVVVVVGCGNTAGVTMGNAAML